MYGDNEVRRLRACGCLADLMDQGAELLSGQYSSSFV
jgi:hypothetical protein